MQIKKILETATGQIKKNKIKNPALEAEILLSHILKRNREFLFTYPGKELAIGQVKSYKKLVARRLKGEPIAYLTGQKEFYGLNFFVNKNVLVPRPATELMVEEALALITRLSPEALVKGGNAQRITLVDVGTGSGCIIITLAKQMSAACRRGRDIGRRLPAGEAGISDVGLLASDISKQALVIAKKNAIFYKVDKRIKFFRGDLLEPIIKNSKLIIDNSKLIILANLPYLTNSQIKSSPTIKYDPKIALDGGKDGLKYYKELFGQVQRLGKLNAAPIFLFCEIDPKQAQKIKKFAQSELLGAEIQIKKDLAGLNRLVIIKVGANQKPG